MQEASAQVDLETELVESKVEVPRLLEHVKTLEEWLGEKTQASSNKQRARARDRKASEGARADM